MNYFELFSLPVQFLTDTAILREKYFALSRNAHPDYFVNSGAAAQQDALEGAAVLNNAYKTLGSRDASIEYVLQLKGLLRDDETYSLPQAFLMEMMEINEMLEEAGDAADAAPRLAVRAKVKQLQEELYEPVRDIIEKYREDAVSGEALQLVKEYYFKKKYLHRVTAGMDQK